ncbi:MAG TPA: phosphotransferase [Thermoanaerobaculia bacterium]
MTAARPPVQTVPNGSTSNGPLPPAERRELADWLAAAGHRLVEVHPLPGDVSTRRYFRLELDTGTAVLALYPQDQEKVCRRFATTSGLLESAGVRVPRLLVADCARRWMLCEDVGAQTLDEWAEGRSWAELLPRYRRVLPPTRAIAELPEDVVAGLCPPLDRELLEWEVRRTWTTFLAPQGLGGDGGEEAELRAALSDLCTAIAAVPPVPCHRDLTPRNLVPLADGGVAFLDHQDLRLGPPLYDLASLLNDTLFPPPAVEDELLAAWGLGAGERVDYHRVAAQRTFKAVGSYAGAAAQGKTRRLALIPPTLSRALVHLAAAPETAGLAPRLAERWRPALAGAAPGG